VVSWGIWSLVIRDDALIPCNIHHFAGLGLTRFGFGQFNGTWVLDLKASDSPERMLKRMGVSALERKLAGSTKLESTYSQSGNLVTITTRGPAFSRTEHLRLDGHPETKTEKGTGTYTIRTSWSHYGKELISTSTFRHEKSEEC
jgi:hypothetical protein